MATYTFTGFTLASGTFDGPTTVTLTASEVTVGLSTEITRRVGAGRRSDFPASPRLGADPPDGTVSPRPRGNEFLLPDAGSIISQGLNRSGGPGHVHGVPCRIPRGRPRRGPLSNFMWLLDGRTGCRIVRRLDDRASGTLGHSSESQSLVSRGPGGPRWPVLERRPARRSECRECPTEDRDRLRWLHREKR